MALARLLDEERNLNLGNETGEARAMAASASNPQNKKFDKSKITCFNCSRKGHFASECRSSMKSKQATKEMTKNHPRKQGGAFNTETDEQALSTEEEK